MLVFAAMLAEPPIQRVPGTELLFDGLPLLRSGPNVAFAIGAIAFGLECGSAGAMTRAAGYLLVLLSLVWRLKPERCLTVLGEKARMTRLAVVLFAFRVGRVVKSDGSSFRRQNKLRRRRFALR